MKVHQVLLDDLQAFYSDPRNFAILAAVVCPDKKKPKPAKKKKRDMDEPENASPQEDVPYKGISLRVVEYFVTEHARKHRIKYPVPGSNVPFLVHVSYEQTMRTKSKIWFDTFARRDRERIVCGEETVLTTCGQGNLIRWAISHGVLDYISQHLADIKQALKEHTQTIAARKAAEAEAMVKPAGIEKRKAEKKSHQASILYSHKADRPIYKVKFGF